jgi:hypothetical protein
MWGMGHMQPLTAPLRRLATDPAARAAAKFWLWWLGAGMLLWLILGVWIPRWHYKSQVVQCMQNLHEIQLGIERFAVDDPQERYPPSTAEIVRAGYLPDLPLNPFSGQAMRQLQQDEAPSRGNFYYIGVGVHGEEFDPATNPTGIASYTLVLCQ